MVDFNAEGTFTANKGHILELVVLGRRDELINTFQLWKEASFNERSTEDNLKNKLRSVLFALFLELDSTLFRKLCERDKRGVVRDRSKYDELKNLLSNSKSISDDELLDTFFVINNVLDGLNLIRLDTKRVYDASNVETENEEKGL